MDISCEIEECKTREQQNSKRSAKACWGTVFSDLGALMSIALPMLMYFTFTKNDFDTSPLLKVVMLLFPCSYSAAGYFLLCYSSRTAHHKTGILYHLLNVLLVTFAAISILSIIVLPIEKWSKRLLGVYSMPSSSFVVSLTYLLYTSCDLTTASFTDTGITAFVELLSLLFLMSYPIFLTRNPEYYPYLSIISAILILARSFKEKYFPNKKTSESVVRWRLLIFFVILGFTTFSYIMAGLSCLHIIKEKCENFAGNQQILNK
ncbi:hypothetical protein [Encephalitozoon cuniculi GB-M1]|uniref:UPF0328 protein ECU03_1620 n=1 Tax=Encephalitozoon cuniculi (strain GB-M1) TaxID=284813 RepID=Y3G2_ENCCU|nr:uncharacterized protein ECU03_1620 [Encephalitozoon cuniculi GB-M1]Q8SVY8.1 RecName: Full=UPF0328 protein ECU03_1620 [Encephalitozoon cuniculi GB-M1]CAD26305.1 hypothetical protein [Encephalitozoon cuniculi GB-M1]